MDKAKAAVSDFLHRDGKHTTTVHETVAPAIKQEHITPTRHENVTTAIDREIHQDHYHTSVQPIHDREVLPEKHTHNLAGVDHREIHHGDHEKTKMQIEAERAQFRNTREVADTQHTHAEAGTLAAEHVHHHVHEHIQPVIQKEIIQPSVVHTTVPIHEVHHKEAKHHTASALPAVSLSEFKKNGGVLSGREEHVDRFEGEPRTEGSVLGTRDSHIIGGHHAKGATHITERDGKGSGIPGTTGTHSHRGEDLRGPNSTHSSMSSSGLGGPVGGPVGHTTSNTSSHTGMDGTKKKASLLDKLNPMVDSNGDGKAGFMK